MIQSDWTKFTLQRPNYFPGQYLLDADFELAHRYLHDRQRYLNSKLHLAGIVEGLEVEAVAGQPDVMIKTGTAIDGEGNLIVVNEAIRRPISASGWLCLRYRQRAQVLQQPEIPDSFTRFVETPELTRELSETRDSKTIILAQVTLENGQVKIDSSVRQYSGVRLPSGEKGVGLQSANGALALEGDLRVMGGLQLNGSTLSDVSDLIDTNSDRATVVPSEKAVKEHLEKRLLERLSRLSLSSGGSPVLLVATSMIARVSNELSHWNIHQEAVENQTAMLQITSKQGEVEKPRLIIEGDSGNVGIGTLTPTRTLEVNGGIRAKHVESTNPMRHRMYPSDPIVYQDIFDAVKAEAIKKYKNPDGYNDAQHAANNKCNDRTAICFGEQTSDDSGALVTVPKGYDTIWVRVIANDGWYRIKAEFLDLPKEDLGYWVAGKRSANCYCPDGSLSDGHHNRHQWLPIPVGRAGTVLLTDRIINYRDMRGMWFSGLGFSKNPWAHATQSAVGYHWQVNGGEALGWEQDNLADDVVAQIPRGTHLEMMVPYIWSGRDKLLYIAEWNYYKNTIGTVNGFEHSNGCGHSNVTVEGKQVGRLLATYNNPFARHWNSKSHNRYIAARIPASFIPDPTAEAPPLLRVQIDMRLQNEDLHFREIGTHDLEVPDMV